MKSLRLGLAPCPSSVTLLVAQTSLKVDTHLDRGQSKASRGGALVGWLGMAFEAPPHLQFIKNFLSLNILPSQRSFFFGSWAYPYPPRWDVGERAKGRSPKGPGGFP